MMFEVMKPYCLFAAWLPWCGIIFHTKTLEVSVDYSRYTKISKFVLFCFSYVTNHFNIFPEGYLNLLFELKK